MKKNGGRHQGQPRRRMASAWPIIALPPWLSLSFFLSLFLSFFLSILSVFSSNRLLIESLLIDSINRDSIRVSINRLY